MVKSAFKKDCGDYEYSWEENECAIVFDEEDCGEGKIYSIYFVILSTFIHYHLQVQANLKKIVQKKGDANFSIYGRNGIMP